MEKAGHRGGQVQEAGLVEPSRDPASRGFAGHREGSLHSHGKLTESSKQGRDWI